MNEEILEYLKFLHIHDLVNIIAIIESIPIYYQTQIKRFTVKDVIETVNHQKMRLQNLTYIARNAFNFSFPNFRYDFQTIRMGPYSLDLDNELQNLINSAVFNNAVSSKKQFAKRYKLSQYDKEYIIDMFKGEENYRNFLELVENKDLLYLKDIAHAISFHNHYSNGSTSKKSVLYKQNDINKYKILHISLSGLVAHKKDNNAYIKELIDIVLNLQRLQNLQNLSL
jgi:hypothetical protein